MERMDIIGVGNKTPDVSINSETSSRKSSGFFEGMDADIFVQSRKNSAAEYSDICPDLAASGEVRKVEEPGRKLSDGDVSRFVRSRAESSSLPDHNAINRAKFTWNNSAEKVNASPENRETVGITRSLSMKTARKLCFGGGIGPDSKPTLDGSMTAKRRPCVLQRSISVPEPRNHGNTEPISREELIRRKRRSVHEIDFSLHAQPGLASQCYMGSSRAFRYPSPLHAISLQSPLCLPGPGYHEKQNGQLDEKQTDVDSTQVTISGTQGDSHSGTITEERPKVDISEQSSEVLDANCQSSTKTPPSPATHDLPDHRFNPTKWDTKLISHSCKTKETSPLNSDQNSVKEKSNIKTRHMSVDRELKNPNCKVDKTYRLPRPQRKGVQEHDIEASYNYNKVASYDSGAHPVGSEQKPQNLEKISSKDYTNFKRSQNYNLEEGDVRCSKQAAMVKHEYFRDTEWFHPGRKSEYPSSGNRHISVRSNLSTIRNSHIDSSGHYNDGVVRSKTPVSQSLSRAGGPHSGLCARIGGTKDSQRVVGRFDGGKQDEQRPQPKRKIACVTPVEIWRVEYGV